MGFRCDGRQPNRGRPRKAAVHRGPVAADGTGMADGIRAWAFAFRNQRGLRDGAAPALVDIPRTHGSGRENGCAAMAAFCTSARDGSGPRVAAERPKTWPGRERSSDESAAAGGFWAWPQTRPTARNPGPNATLRAVPAISAERAFCCPKDLASAARGRQGQARAMEARWTSGRSEHVRRYAARRRSAVARNPGDRTVQLRPVSPGSRELDIGEDEPRGNCDQVANTVAAERHQLVRVHPNEGKSDISDSSPTQYGSDRRIIVDPSKKIMNHQ